MIQTTPGRYHGFATLSLPAEVEAGSTCGFSIVYTVGDFGIDDSGSLKLCWRFASDIGTPQFEDAEALNYLLVTTTADCQLHPRFDTKGNTRPWGRTVYVRIQKGFLSPGDTIRFDFHRAEMQTFVERGFRFRLYVDDVATYVYNEIEVTPAVDIVPGPAERLRLYLPSLLKPGDAVDLRIVAEDRWANPTTVPGRLRLRGEGPLGGLPETVGADAQPDAAAAGAEPATAPSGVRLPASAGRPAALRGPGITAAGAGVARVWAAFDGGGSQQEFESNPLVIDPKADGRLVWADMHGQSGETIGTGSIDDYFRFARDLACVDVAGHQGNDFQITREFWARLQGVTAGFNENGRFITFPGYEWSGNTALGGDRNVYFRSEGRHIRRSSHALSPDLLDAGDDCTTVEELFEALSGEDCLVVPHVGGRYADVYRHGAELERSVEVHSAWGTFEWMIHDAIREGHIAGIVAMSDGHKGRPGASHPGRGKFGSYGGLTCLSVGDLTRDEVWSALRSRRHYATTGARTVLFVEAEPLGTGATLRMGDHLEGSQAKKLRLSARYVGTGPIIAVDVFNGLDLVDHRRFPGDGDRILVWWSGSLRRGRGRQIDWSGSCEVDGGEISDIKAVNFHSPDCPLRLDTPSRLSWESFTTGGMSGFVGRLSNPRSGALRIRTDRLDYDVDLSSLDAEEVTVAAGGVDAQLRVMRLPSENEVKDLEFEAEYALGNRNALYLRVTQEDGTLTWSSPIYID